MTQSVIGALRVTLGLDSAQFHRGARNAQTTMQQMRRTMLAVSGAMAAVGTGAFAMVRSTANAGREIGRQAQLANTSAGDFQRMAVAARSVGIEQDKTADILKDFSDRVGDFLQTGAGPMADFFENIAPKVGVTADQFRELSGADALRLYVRTLEEANLSQNEMTFFMEAMSSESTALLPLLRNNGAEMDRLADAAERAGGILSDDAIENSIGFHEQLDLMREASLGLRNGIAEQLLPAFTEFLSFINETAIPAIGRVIEQVGRWIDAFRDLPGPVQEAVGVVAAALGAGGPLILAIGAVRVAITGLIAASGPIGLFIAAAGLLAAAWVQWGDDIKAAIGPAVEWIGGKFDALIGWVGRVRDIASDALNALTRLFSLGESGEALISAMNSDVARVAGEGIGAALTEGLVDGATDPAAVGELREYLSQFPDAARDELQIRSPSRIFQEIGRFVSEGFALGIREGGAEPVAAISDVVDGVVEASDRSSGALSSLRSAANSAFRDFLKGATSAREALAGFLGALSDVFLDAAFNNLFGSMFTPGGFLSSIIPGFASGTTFAPGGLAMVGERGPELVNLPRGSRVLNSQRTAAALDGMGPGGSVTINMPIDARGADPSVLPRMQALVDGLRRDIPSIIKQHNANPFVRR